MNEVDSGTVLAMLLFIAFIFIKCVVADAQKRAKFEPSPQDFAEFKKRLAKELAAEKSKEIHDEQ